MSQETVLRRIETLERENRILRVWAGIVALLFVAILLRASPLVSQGKPGKVEATAFVLRDDEGRIRATLSGLNGGGAAVSFYDTKKHLRLLVGMNAGGQPSVQLNDSKEVGRAVFGLDEYDVPGCDLSDRQGHRRVRLAATNSAAVLTFTDARGDDRVTLMNSHNSKLAGLTLMGEGEASSKVVIFEGAPVSIISGKDGKILWSAP